MIINFFVRHRNIIPWLMPRPSTMKHLVGNVVNILATCHPNTCRSRIFGNIFNVADTVTGSQSWSHVGKIPWYNICEASTKLVCQRWTSLSLPHGMVALPTHWQTSSQHVATSATVTRHVSKNGGLQTWHNTVISSQDEPLNFSFALKKSINSWFSGLMTRTTNCDRVGCFSLKTGFVTSPKTKCPVYNSVLPT